MMPSHDRRKTTDEQDDPTQPRNVPGESDTLPPNDDPEAMELERLYQQALDAMESVDAGLDLASETIGQAGPRRREAGDGEQTANAGAPSQAGFSPDDRPIEQSAGPVPAQLSEAGMRANRDALQTVAESFATDGRTLQCPQPAKDHDGRSDSAPRRLTPKQIIEAALFVGGLPLTTKRLSSLLDKQFDRDYIEAAIDELIDRYAREERPYEIHFGEGGYRLVLRPEFEAVRNRVFGVGPKEIKLSQEALEVLSLIAYKQPIARREIEAARASGSGGVLRHLLRRELIEIERPDQHHDDVQYRTTARFLEAFGLARIEELPQAGELSLK